MVNNPCKLNLCFLIWNAVQVCGDANYSFGKLVAFLPFLFYIGVKWVVSGKNMMHDQTNHGVCWKKIMILRHLQSWGAFVSVQLMGMCFLILHVFRCEMSCVSCEQVWFGEAESMCSSKKNSFDIWGICKQRKIVFLCYLISNNSSCGKLVKIQRLMIWFNSRSIASLGGKNLICVFGPWTCIYY